MVARLTTRALWLEKNTYGHNRKCPGECMIRNTAAGMGCNEVTVTKFLQFLVNLGAVTEQSYLLSQIYIIVTVPEVRN